MYYKSAFLHELYALHGGNKIRKPVRGYEVKSTHYREEAKKDKWIECFAFGNRHCRSGKVVKNFLLFLHSCIVHRVLCPVVNSSRVTILFLFIIILICDSKFLIQKTYNEITNLDRLILYHPFCVL